MPNVVGVRFRKHAKIYYFDPKDFDLVIEDAVIVETKHGLGLGKVVHFKDLPTEQIGNELRSVIRKATKKDITQAKRFSQKEQEAYEICLQKITQHTLAMKLIKAEYNFNGSHITFYFSAEGRIDFRELVKDLTTYFKAKIELRQIGPRDEAKILGGIGRCGRTICCYSWINRFKSISMDMPYHQFLGTKNPDKISGICGRLLCCLAYEEDFYKEKTKEFPAIGTQIKTAKGVGKVIDINIFREKIKIYLEEESTIIEVDKNDYQPSA